MVFYKYTSDLDKLAMLNHHKSPEGGGKRINFPPFVAILYL